MSAGRTNSERLAPTLRRHAGPLGLATDLGRNGARGTPLRRSDVMRAVALVSGHPSPRAADAKSAPSVVLITPGVGGASPVSRATSLRGSRRVPRPGRRPLGSPKAVRGLA